MTNGMNELIKELAEQAGITTNLDTDFFETNPNKWVDYYSEKLAELIVQECLHNMENCDGDLDLAIWKTKKDFGLNDE